MVPKTKGLSLSQRVSSFLHLSPSNPVLQWATSTGCWGAEWPLLCLTSLTWGLHPQPLPISWGIHLSSGLSFQLCCIVGGVFFSSLYSCLLAEPCSTVTALCSPCLLLLQLTGVLGQTSTQVITLPSAVWDCWWTLVPAPRSAHSVQILWDCVL